MTISCHAIHHYNDDLLRAGHPFPARLPKQAPTCTPITAASRTISCFFPVLHCRESAMVQLSVLLCLIPLALENAMMQAHITQECLVHIVAALDRHRAEVDIQTKGLVLLGVLIQVRHQTVANGTWLGVLQALCCKRGHSLLQCQEQRIAPCTNLAAVSLILLQISDGQPKGSPRICMQGAKRCGGVCVLSRVMMLCMMLCEFGNLKQQCRAGWSQH